MSISDQIVLLWIVWVSESFDCLLFNRPAKKLVYVITNRVKSNGQDDFHLGSKVIWQMIGIERRLFIWWWRPSRIIEKDSSNLFIKKDNIVKVFHWKWQYVEQIEMNSGAGVSMSVPQIIRQKQCALTWFVFDWSRVASTLTLNSHAIECRCWYGGR